MSWMEPYLIRRSLRIVKLLRACADIRFTEILTAVFKKNERKKLLDIYHELGIKEAGKYFVIDPNSEEFPFLEAFIFKLYQFCDFNGKVVIDIGAQTGDSVLYFSLRGAKIIYAFEPLKDNFRTLERNVIQNKINCKCFNIGLGNTTKNITVSVSSNMAIATSTIENLYHESIIMNELDNLNLNADIIKIDVEGFEVEVLRGGLSTINNAKNILIETHSKSLQVEVAKLLSKMGFHLSKIITYYNSKNVRIEYWLK